MPRRPRPSVSGLVLGLAAALTGGCQSVRYVEAFHPEGAVYRVELVADAGAVELREGPRLRVERAIKAPEGALELSHRVDSGVLHLEARCAALAPCAVDTVLELPPGLPVRVELGTGTVHTVGISAADILVDRGEVTSDHTERLIARVGQGSVRGDVPAGGQARVTVADGDIELALDDDSWNLGVTADTLSLDGVASDESAAGSLELTAPGGAVRLWRSSPEGAVALGS